MSRCLQKSSSSGNFLVSPVGYLLDWLKKTWVNQQWCHYSGLAHEVWSLKGSALRYRNKSKCFVWHLATYEVVSLQIDERAHAHQHPHPKLAIRVMMVLKLSLLVKGLALYPVDRLCQNNICLPAFQTLSCAADSIFSCVCYFGVIVKQYILLSLV